MSGTLLDAGGAGKGTLGAIGNGAGIVGSSGGTIGPDGALGAGIVGLPLFGTIGAGTPGAGSGVPPIGRGSGISADALPLGIGSDGVLGIDNGSFVPGAGNG